VDVRRLNMVLVDKNAEKCYDNRIKIVLEKSLMLLKQLVKDQLCSLKVVTVWIFLPFSHRETEKMA
jgi:hypothetical protein